MCTHDTHNLLRYILHPHTNTFSTFHTQTQLLIAMSIVCHRLMQTCSCIAFMNVSQNVLGFFFPAAAPQKKYPIIPNKLEHRDSWHTTLAANAKRECSTSVTSPTRFSRPCKLVHWHPSDSSPHCCNTIEKKLSRIFLYAVELQFPSN